MTVSVTFEGGGAGVLEAISGDRVRLRSPRAFAPGTPVVLSAAVGDGDGGDSGERTVVLPAKTIGSKRDADGSFLVDMKLISVSKEIRQRLERTLAGGAKSP